MSNNTPIRIYVDGDRVWATKSFPGYSADWIANADYTKLEKPIHIEELN